MAQTPVPAPIVLNIRIDHAAGLSALQLAAKYNLSRGVIYRITNGDAHPEVGGPLRPKRARLHANATQEEVRAEGRQRILARIDVAENGCWHWNQGGTGNKGYFTMHLAGKDYPVHRLAYELFVGPIPTGMVIDHACHTRDSSCFAGNGCLHRRCVRPDHLQPVDQATNVQLGRSWSINGLKTHCPRGHAYDGANTCYVKTKTGGTARRCRACGRDKQRERRRRHKESLELAASHFQPGLTVRECESAGIMVVLRGQASRTRVSSRTWGDSDAQGKDGNTTGVLQRHAGAVRWRRWESPDGLCLKVLRPSLQRGRPRQSAWSLNARSGSTAKSRPTADNVEAQPPSRDSASAPAAQVGRAGKTVARAIQGSL